MGRAVASRCMPADRVRLWPAHVRGQAGGAQLQSQHRQPRLETPILVGLGNLGGNFQRGAIALAANGIPIAPPRATTGGPPAATPRAGRGSASGRRTAPRSSSTAAGGIRGEADGASITASMGGMASRSLAKRISPWRILIPRALSSARFVSLPGRMKLSIPRISKSTRCANNALASVLPTNPQMPVIRILTLIFCLGISTPQRSDRLCFRAIA